MNLKPLISVIIPVYNVELYLCKCIDSVLSQTYENLEIILVDDGSPDNCGEICDKYALKDSRIRVIHKANGGLSDARNAGLDIIQGEYVAFVDSDDWIEPTMYKTLLKNMMEFHADMSFGGVADELENKESCVISKVSDYGCTSPFSENNIEAMRRYFNGSWAAWDKLYKAELFDNIRFPKGEINEDEAIVIQLLSLCQTVCYTNEIFYHYIKRNNNSITNASFSKKKLAWSKHCADNFHIICENYEELKNDAAKRYRNSLIWSITEIAKCEEIKEYREEICYLMKQLKFHKRLFDRIKFSSKKEHIMYYAIKLLRFKGYRKLIRFFRR